MGYTHYFYQQRSWTILEWAQLRKAWALLSEEAKALGIVLKGYDGTGEPSVCDHELLFNGDGDKGHETLGLVKTPQGRKMDDGYFAFCKTARKPYDVIVQTILLLSNMICVHIGTPPFGTPMYKLGSDGGKVVPENPEWRDAFNLADKVYAKMVAG